MCVPELLGLTRRESELFPYSLKDQSNSLVDKIGQDEEDEVEETSNSIATASDAPLDLFTASNAHALLKLVLLS